MVTSHLGMARWLGGSGAVLVVLGPLLLVPRGTIIINGIHDYGRKKGGLRNQEKIEGKRSLEVEKHEWKSNSEVRSSSDYQDSQ